MIKMSQQTTAIEQRNTMFEGFMETQDEGEKKTDNKRKSTKKTKKSGIRSYYEDFSKLTIPT